MIGEASFPARMRLAGDVEDAPVHVLGEMLRPQEIRDAVEGVIIDEDGAEQGLFRLDIMRGEAECSARGGRRGPALSAKFSIGWHGRSRAKPESEDAGRFLSHAAAARGNKRTRRNGQDPAIHTLEKNLKKKAGLRRPSGEALSRP